MTIEINVGSSVPTEIGPKVVSVFEKLGGSRLAAAVSHELDRELTRA